MAAFWMIGFEEKPKQSAEICISEIFGRQVAEDASVIGYGVHPFSDANIEDDFHKEYFEMDASDFHIYAAEWTPAQVDFFIDNQKTRTIPQSPQYPMQFLLGIYEIPDHLTAASRDAHWPKAFEVDYVRAYQPMLGY
jgi:beta-glucanase (GH16 family)